MHKALPTPDEHNSSAARCHSPKPDSPPGKRQVLRSPAGTSGMPRPEGPAVSRSLPRPAQRRGAALPFLLRLLLLPATSRGTHLRRPPPRPSSAHRRRLCARRPPRRQAQDPPRRMDRSARGRRAAEGGRQRAGGEGPQRRHWSGPRLTRLPPGTAAASCTAGCAERPRGRDGPRLPTAAGGAGSATAPSTAGPTAGGGVTAPGQGTVGPCSAESARGAARWRGRAAPSLTPPRGRSRAVPQAAAVPCPAGSFGRSGGASVGVFKPILQAWNYNHRRTFSSPSSFQSMSKTFNRDIFFQIYR